MKMDVQCLTINLYGPTFLIHKCKKQEKEKWEIYDWRKSEKC